MRLTLKPIGALLTLLACSAAAAAADAAPSELRPRKPVIAVFPLGGNAKQELREACAFSLRSKLERDATYDVIDGPKMQDLAAEAAEPITAATSAKAVSELGKLVDAHVLVWGDLTNAARETVLKLNILDLREKDPKPRELSKTIKAPTDLRFISEQLLESLPGIAKFEHPSEVAVQNDPAAEALWKKNPNLVANGDFSDFGCWEAIYQSEKYLAPLSDKPPAIDKVAIYKLREDGRINHVLAMNLSRYCAENNGMACLSDSIRIQPDTRYRLSFRYKSDGPTLHVFVKGYSIFEKNGRKQELEIYRRQVPPTGKTDGKWVTIIDEMNPQHVAFPVQTLRIDLYAYLSPGTVMFDDVILKAVGRQTHQAKDEAIDKPTIKQP